MNVSAHPALISRNPTHHQPVRTAATITDSLSSIWPAKDRAMSPKPDSVNVAAVLSGANLTGANLSRTNLRSADLSGANLRGANLIGTNLSVADLIGADLTGATLSGANLRGAKNLIQTQLNEACGNNETELPEGLDLTPLKLCHRSRFRRRRHKFFGLIITS